MKHKYKGLFVQIRFLSSKSHCPTQPHLELCLLIALGNLWMMFMISKYLLPFITPS